MTQEEGAAPPREQGWWGPLLATLALLIFPATPPFALLLPVDQTILLLAPALALMAIAGWRSGGRFTLAATWTAFAVYVVWVSGEPTPFALLSRGWGVILAACFAGTLLLGGEVRFLPRALLAILAALLLGTLTVAVTEGGFGAAVGVLSEEFTRRAAEIQRAWQEFTAQPQWQELARDNAGADALAAQVEAQFTALPTAAKVLMPAMLALESLAVLALAWALYHRFGRVRLGPPLAALRDLRFHDGLVWGLIAGLLVLVVPMPNAFAAFGINCLVFFGALYVMRGLGVFVWFLRPGKWMAVLWSIVLVMFWSVIAAVALVIGVGDTWLDWRNRPRPQSQRSE
ncbi:DUF2232 domain-containing protein [Pseudogemmatithrix spongiicola]|uniref:DUF2232 domain-containing protein n=1 Tax=Pseudogemmatithrix spongiicola TaxID=3062599 RepID=A0AA49JTU1_9BACT|nr:DUF2232 domain-containing protein [Gemmatimonadaceae bacterium 'strain 138']WKW14672.1 DUF2232 domain-containing protein [Gemmatimonadaceae bacterium 'strain 318']